MKRNVQVIYFKGGWVGAKFFEKFRMIPPMGQCGSKCFFVHLYSPIRVLVELIVIEPNRTWGSKHVLEYFCALALLDPILEV